MKRLITAAISMFLIFSFFTGCGQEKTIDLNALNEKVQNAFGEENKLSMQQLTKEECQERYGLTDDMYTEFLAEIPMINVQIDEFAAIRANSGKVKEVEAAIKQFQTAYKEDMNQYPSNQVKIQASQVVTKGDYVFFIMMGPIPSEAEEQGEEAILKAAQDNNQRIAEIINSFFD